ncbi:hypothetical protein QBC32DRAFT_346125 [Pseudoneurospora amorphoporcata]|uniref:Uncharacterized protein n=1 Tax=Pseudoneurospora amorphoporcata TaxID=241081 RepID=A0AAN6SEE3_9PEZI|nr:hypothetical protein QBC32DRAFT_346125 [Pseudoneurospora amorphoporcata]
MDFHLTSFQWDKAKHLNYFKICKGKDAAVEVITKFASNENKLEYQEHSICTEKELNEWIDKISENILPSSDPTAPRMCVVMLGRGAHDRAFKDGQGEIPALPFKASGPFEKLVSRFHIHPRIVKTIKKEACYFSVQHHGHEEDHGYDMNERYKGKMTTCTARTSSKLRNDIAISVTYFPETQVNLAVFYGCNKKQKVIIKEKIKGCPLKYNHPLLLLGLFFELERKRLDDEVGELIQDVGTHLQNCGALDLDKQALDLDKQSKTTITENLKLTSALTELEIVIKAVKQQLVKFKAEGLKLETPGTNHSSKSSVSSLTSVPLPNGDEGYDSHESQPTVAAGQERKVSDTMLAAPTAAERWASQKIRERTDDMIADLDEWLNDCASEKETLSLHMKTTLNTISLKGNQASSAMISIALVTMVFLPTGTVAAIFSANLFAWDGSGAEKVGRFVAICLGLTFAVFTVWLLIYYGLPWLKRRRGRSQRASHSA